jgi:hypothetical protein
LLTNFPVLAHQPLNSSFYFYQLPTSYPYSHQLPTFAFQPPPSLIIFYPLS